MQLNVNKFVAVISFLWLILSNPCDLYLSLIMKPKGVVADEMFPEGAGPYMDLEEAGGSSGLLMDLAANEKSVHADFFNDFEDLFDDEDLQ
ncbi:COP9 signalosome complex subunit 9 [Nephila pilipes]|uniref:COP9 signalosome complex subunit 9 n=1 Tax=Nephila pilipes TaxID=299642 RepID=A0A8X6N5M0_NEPPI|nr:COP9 signalosome complex subunit 9 [Nephila pilipes]